MANEAAASLLGFDLQCSVHKPIDDVLADSALVRVIRDARARLTTASRRHVE